MAKVKNGLVIGRVGHLVYYVRDGQQCVRTIAQKQIKTQSPAQLLQQAKFTAIHQWLTPLKGFFHGFKIPGMARAAFSNGIKKACVVEGGNVSIDASKMMFTHGSLQGMKNGTASIEDRRLCLTWSDNTCLVMSNANDRMIFLLYNPETMVYFSNIGTQKMPHRFQRNYTIDLPVTAKGCFHLYATFCNTYRTVYSDSTYLGEVEL